jgi:hypothetical protein
MPAVLTTRVDVVVPSGAVELLFVTVNMLVDHGAVPRACDCKIRFVRSGSTTRPASAASKVPEFPNRGTSGPYRVNPAEVVKAEVAA